LTGQLSDPITGLPFEFAPGVVGKGWHLNVADGVADAWELAALDGNGPVADVGGASATLADPADYFAGLTAPTYYDIDPVNDSGLYRMLFRHENFYGRAAWMSVPGKVEGSGQFLPIEGRCADWLVIYLAPTRTQGTPHQYGPFVGAPVAPGFFEEGATVAYVVDQRGQHPLVETIQNCVFLADSARAMNPELRKVVVYGSSYGSVAGLLLAMMYPDKFDGFWGAGGYLDIADFDEWNAMMRVVEKAQGRNSILSSLDGTNRNGALTALGWRGLSQWNVDLTHPDVLRSIKIPTRVVIGDSDGHWISNGLASTVNQLAQATTYPGTSIPVAANLKVVEVEEAGHALAAPVGCYQELGHDLERLEFIDLVNQVGTTQVPRVFDASPLPYARTGRYDSFLMEAARDDAPVSWLTREDSLGNSPGVGTNVGAAVLQGNALYSGDRAGWVSKKVWDPASQEFVEGLGGWRRFVGTQVLCVQVGTLDGEEVVVAGSQRGLTVLAEASGLCLAEETTLSDARHIAIGDVIPGGGDEIVYQALQVRLVVARRSGAQVDVVHFQDIGAVSDIEIAAAAGNPALLASLTHGHVARLEYQPDGGDLKLVCTAISEYLHGTPCSMAIVESGGDSYVAVGSFVPGDDPASPFSLDEHYAPKDLAAKIPASVVFARAPKRPAYYPVHVLSFGDLSTHAKAGGSGRAWNVYPGQPGEFLLAQQCGGSMELSAFDVDLNENTGASTNSYGSAWVAFNRTTGPVAAVAFHKTELEAFDANENLLQPVTPSPGRASTTAVTHFRAGADWEVSILTPDATHPRPADSLASPSVLARGISWNVETYPIRSTAQGWRLDDTPTVSETIQTEYRAGNSAAGNQDPGNNYPPHKTFPTQLLRHPWTEGQAASASSFTTFRHAGTTLQEPLYLGGDLVSSYGYASSDAGRLCFYSNADWIPVPAEEALHLFGMACSHKLTGVARYCDERYGGGVAAETGDGRNQSQIEDTQVLPHWVMAGDQASNFWAADGLPTGIDPVAVVAARMPWLGGPVQAGVLATTPGGRLYGFRYQTPHPEMVEPSQPVRLGRGPMALAVDNIEAGESPPVHDLVYAGSLWKDGDGKSLYVLDKQLQVIAAADAGHVVGIAPLVDENDEDLHPATSARELVVGGANGDLSIWSFDPQAGTLVQLQRCNLGRLFVGGRNSLRVMAAVDSSGQQSVLIGTSIDGGYELLQLHPDNL